MNTPDRSNPVTSDKWEAFCPWLLNGESLWDICSMHQVSSNHCSIMVKLGICIANWHLQVHGASWRICASQSIALQGLLTFSYSCLICKAEPCELFRPVRQPGRDKRASTGACAKQRARLPELPQQSDANAHEHNCHHALDPAQIPRAAARWCGPDMLHARTQLYSHFSHLHSSLQTARFRPCSLGAPLLGQ